MFCEYFGRYFPARYFCRRLLSRVSRPFYGAIEKQRDPYSMSDRLSLTQVPDNQAHRYGEMEDRRGPDPVPDGHLNKYFPF